MSTFSFLCVRVGGLRWVFPQVLSLTLYFPHLQNCNLTGSDLQDANLRGANVKNATFEEMLTPLHMSQSVR